MEKTGQAACSRRRFLKATLAAAVTGPSLTACTADSGKPAVTQMDPITPYMENLRTCASRRSLRYGAAVEWRHLTPDNSVWRTFVAECSSLTPENAMKWGQVAPHEGDYQFEDMDNIARFARDNGMALRGHTLLWDKSVPNWATERISQTRRWRHVRSHIEKVVSRYGAQVGEWDVVNEPIEVGDREDGLRNSLFLEAFGPRYIDWAFWAAYDFAPHADRFINEYGLEYDTRDNGLRRLALLRLIEGMRSRGVPLTGVGLQAHLDLRNGAVYTDGVYGLLRDISDLGLKISVTELDVREDDTSISLAERDRRVADETRRYLNVVRQFPAVTSISTWGLSDGDSWLRQGPDGLPTNRGLPYDDQWKPKRMHLAMQRAMGLTV